MDYLAEKFARLGTDNAPGQEGLQKAETRSSSRSHISFHFLQSEGLLESLEWNAG